MATTQIDRTLRSNLHKACGEGTLTYELLSRAVRKIDNGGPGCIPESIGVTWLWRNIPYFLGMDIDHAKFITSHSDNGDFIRCVLGNTELLERIPEEDRDDYVISYFSLMHVTELEPLIAAGVDRDLLAMAIEDDILKVEPATDKTRGIVNAVSIFLDHKPRSGQSWVRCLSRESLAHWEGNLKKGITSFAPPTDCWTILTEDEFVQIVGHCVERRPLLVIKHRENLALWMSQDKLQECLDNAASLISVIGNLKAEDFASFSLEARMDLIRRLDPSKVNGYSAVRIADLIICVLAELDQCQGKAFLEEVSELISVIPTLILGQQLLVGDRGMRIGWLCSQVYDRLKKEGYIRGRLVEGTFRKRGITLRQLELRSRNSTYIQDSRDYDAPSFQEGDEVFVHPDRARTISQRRGRSVRVTRFLSLTKSRRH